MTRAVVVTGAAAAALLVGVLAVRGGTAVDQVALVDAAPEPSPSPSEDVPEHVLLEANGLPGLRLGTVGETAVAQLEEAHGPAGCRLGWGLGPDGSGPLGPGQGWDTSTWVVDDRVVGVVLNQYADDQQASDSLRTWLGPTLGSPLAAAQELPGARTDRHTTFDGTGPTVSVVTVPLDGVEVVFGDAPYWPGPVADEEGPSTGRVTSIEVRRPSARACSMADAYAAQRPSAEVLDADGTGRVRLGQPVQPLLDDGLLQEETGTAVSRAPTCRSFWVPDGNLHVTALDDVVTSVQAFGDRETSFGLRTGDDVEQVRAVFPELGRAAASGLGALEVDVDGNAVRLEMYEGLEFVPDLERPVVGGPRVVQAITVLTREAAREGDAC